MINLNDLTAFLAAAECGNFSETGRKLHLSQPAISQRIDSLEKKFGTKLFMRQGRTVRLTEAGQALQPIARELLSSARRLEETMASLQGEVVGEMNIGCSTAYWRENYRWVYQARRLNTANWIIRISSLTMSS